MGIFRRKQNTTESSPPPDLSMVIVQAAGELLKAQFQGETQLRLKRAEHELERMELEAKLRREETEFKQKRRDFLRTVASKGGKKSQAYQHQKVNECFACTHPSSPDLSMSQIEEHLKHGGSGQQLGN